MNIDEMKDRIARAEEIQRYTENRCEALEKKNKVLAQNLEDTEIVSKALEKENADLERKLEQTEKDLADYQFNYSTIKELEKENAELKENNQFLNNLVKEKEQRGLEIQEDLLKENAELKEKLNIQERVNKEMISPALDRNLKQLTKAKEIIKEFLSYYHSNNYPYQMLEILGKAEQFLKEVKK